MRQPQDVAAWPGGVAVHLPVIRHRGSGQSMEQTPPVVFLSAVHQSFPLDQGSDLQVLDIPHRKRNKKVAIKPWLRRLTGAHLAMELVASFANRSHLFEAGERTDERTSTTRCAHAHARPYPRHSVPCLALPAPLDGHVRPTVPPLLSSRLALIGTLDRDAQQPFCYASIAHLLSVYNPTGHAARLPHGSCRGEQ